MNNKFNLRDLRRMLRRGNRERVCCALRYSGRNLCMPCTGFARATCPLSYSTLQSILDRLITVEGPKAPLDPKDSYRPKGTNEVAPSGSETDSPLHGGDGNSGECDHTAQNPNAGESADLVPAAKDDDESRPAEASTVADSPTVGEDSTEAHANAQEETLSAEGSPPAAPGRTADDTLTCDASEEARSVEPTRDTVQDCDSGSGDVSSPAGCSTFGGVHATEEYTRRVKIDKRALREIRRALEKLVRRACQDEDEPSPRLDAVKLVTHLTSHQGGINRCHRLEVGRPTVIIAADVSGSCSACANETWAAALELSKESNVIAVEHSNGTICKIVQFNAPREVVNISNLNDWLRLVRRHNTAAVVCFGDSDAIECYRAMADEGVKVYWLDSYSKVGGVRPAPQKFRKRTDDWKVRPTMFVGVGTAADAAIALRSCLQGDQHD